MAPASQKATPPPPSCCAPGGAGDSAPVVSRLAAPSAAPANAVGDWTSRSDDQRVNKVAAIATLISPVDSLPEPSTNAPTAKGIDRLATSLILFRRF